MVKRGHYNPPNGVSASPGDIRSLFNDSRIAWPKRAHWWRYVEENDTFALWILNNAAGSPTTAFEHGKVLNRFLDRMGWKLDDLVNNASSDRMGFERRLEVFARGLEAQGYKRGSINNYFKAIRSWLRYNGIELTRRIKLNQTASKREKVPSPDTVALILKGANARQAVCVCCVAYGGLRTEVLG